VSFTLVIPGPPRGKGRHRAVRTKDGGIRTYTDDATMRAEDRVRAAWVECGRPWVDGPLVMRVEVTVERPGSHWRVNGELSAVGKRAPYPTRRPDLSNVMKMVEDALNGCAYKDDAQIVEARLTRRWARRGHGESVLVYVASVDHGVHQLGSAA